MIIDKNTTVEEIEKIHPGEQIKITKDVALNKQLLDFLVKTFPESHITILSGYDESQNYFADCLYNEAETEVLADNVNHIRKTYNTDITFDEQFSVEQALRASRKVNMLVNEVENAKVDGKPLSNLEKFLYAYQTITDKVYKEVNDGENLGLSRNPIAVLNGDRIVCVGFANMLSLVCNRLNIPCTMQTIVSWDTEKNCYGNHSTCTVRIDDDKYGLHGVYHSDPTGDSATENLNAYGTTAFNFALIPYSQVDTIYPMPIMIDAIVGGINVDHTDLETAMQEGDIYPIKKVLSKLFPEKTNGLPQNEILKNQALKVLNDYDITSKINADIDKITEQEAEEAYAQHIRIRVMNLNRLLYENRNGMFRQHLNSVIFNLASLGHSKEEIKNIVKEYYDEEKILPFLKSQLSRNIDSKSAAFERALKNEIASLHRNLSQAEKFIDATNIEKAKPKDAASSLKFVAEEISRVCINREFLEENYKPDVCFVHYLLKKGYPFEDIKEMLKLKVEDVDLAKMFFEAHDNDMIEVYETNEQELYTGKFLPHNIYNEPYKEDYEKLKSQASPVTGEMLRKAFKQIYLSQGNDKDFADKLVELTLRRTNLLSQQSFE